MQDQFSVYSVTRLGPAADFTDPAVSASLRPFLNALAHVEEAGHAGSLKVTEEVLNPRHWAAVGSLGAAHLVADQDPPRPYDEQRLPRVLHKYFIPYLVSLLQRAALQRLLGEARGALAAAGDAAQRAGQGSPVVALPERLRALNGQALALTVKGSSSRPSRNAGTKQRRRQLPPSPNRLQPLPPRASGLPNTTDRAKTRRIARTVPLNSGGLTDLGAYATPAGPGRHLMFGRRRAQRPDQLAG